MSNDPKKTATAATPRTRTVDPEMRAASIITRLLGELDAEARRRLVGYLADRYLPANKTATTSDPRQ